MKPTPPAPLSDGRELSECTGLSAGSRACGCRQCHPGRSVGLYRFPALMFALSGSGSGRGEIGGFAELSQARWEAAVALLDAGSTPSPGCETALVTPMRFPPAATDSTRSPQCARFVPHWTAFAY